MAEPEWPIGIDLGTTCSCVAVWGNNGVEIIPNELGSRTTPSYVSFTEYDRFMGEAAVNQATMNPRNTIFDAKRLIGRRFSDKSVQLDNEMRPYKVINGTDSCETDQLRLDNEVRQYNKVINVTDSRGTDQPMFVQPFKVINGTDPRGTDQPMLDNEVQPCKVINGTEPRYTDQVMIPVSYMREAKKFTPEEITAMTLTKMKGVAEAFTGRMVKSAVISVPAFFNDSQRRATRDAGTIAGFEWIRIINEPTAVALAYYELDMKMNRGKRGGKNVLVFDLGGGTFDVSLIKVEKGKITVKAVSGDTNLGGADFDNRMVREFITRFKHEHDKDITENPRALARLRVASEKAKKVLSLLPQADVQIDYFFDGIDFSSTITRAHFEELNMDLFEKCIDTVWQCLKDASTDKRDVDDVVLVGGSSRIPKVQQMLQDFFDGKELCKRVHADEAVAYGAAMHAFYTCAGNSMSKEIVLSDVTPLSLGVELKDGTMKVIVSRNKFIPIKKRNSSCTLCENHNDGFKFGVYEGEYTNIKDNNFLGECEFARVRLPKETTIHINFNVDEDGLLDVFAEINEQGMSPLRTNMNHQGRLTRNNIGRMMNEARHYKEKDEERRQLLQAKSALESYVNTISDQLGDDKDPRMKDLESALELLEQNSELPKLSAFKDKLSDLKKIFGNSENNVTDHVYHDC